jgi:hypothetical protein
MRFTNSLVPGEGATVEVSWPRETFLNPASLVEGAQA